LVVATESGDVEFKVWYEDPQKLSEFLALYESKLQESLQKTDELRSAHSPERQASLDATLDKIASGTVFGYTYPGDFEGLSYDTLLTSQNYMRAQFLEYAQWENSEGSLEELPSVKVMCRAPMKYPPSFLIFQIRGDVNVEFSEQQIEHVSRLRNEFVRQYTMLKGREFELRPAALWAAEELNIPQQTLNPLSNFIPEWEELSNSRRELCNQYIRDIELFANSL